MALSLYRDRIFFYRDRESSNSLYDNTLQENEPEVTESIVDLNDECEDVAFQNDVS